MKFEERSYLNRCFDVVLGRHDDEFTFFFRVPSYTDLPKEAAETHRKEVVDFLKSNFDCQEMYSFKGTSTFKAVCKKEEFYSKFPDFPKESEDDNAFRKEAEIYLKKTICARSAAVYSKDPGLWETANLVSAKVFPKFPYPIKADLSVEEKDVVTVSFPWLAYRFYAPIFEKTVRLLVKSFKAKVVEEPPVTQMTSSAWTKRVVVEGENKNYAANLVKQGLEKLGIPVRFEGKEREIKPSHLEKFVRIVSDITPQKKERSKGFDEIKDRIVPYNDRPFLYVQLFPQTLERVKDKIEEFVKEKNLKGGQFVPGRGYMKSYIIGDSKTMASFESRVALAKELSEKTGVGVEIPKPKVGLYKTKDSSGNMRFCVRIPRPWSRSEKSDSAHEYSKSLNGLVKEFQANDWESVFPGVYVLTYSVLIPKDADDELEKAKDEAIKIISGFPDIEYEFVDMKEKKAERAEREIRKNIAEIER